MIMSVSEHVNTKRMRVEDDGGSPKFIRKKTCLNQVFSAERRTVLSPITEISKNLSTQATIGTPKLKVGKKIARKISELSFVDTMDDISFYDEGEQQPVIPSQDQDTFPDELLCDEPTRNLKSSHKLSYDDFDCNSMDSGFNSNGSLRRRSTGASLIRSNSSESIDDEYIELMALDDELESSELPSNMNSLITSSIKESPVEAIKRPVPPRMSNSMRARSLIFEPKDNKEDDPKTPKSFKQPPYARRLSTVKDGSPRENLNVLRKTMSMNDAQLMSALDRPTSDELIGDHTKPYSLPIIKGRHDDLKTISCETLAKLLTGEFKDNIASYKVIDCRYPYEYEGGHIKDAVNWYNQEMILENLVNKDVFPADENNKRNILIFHCEFSSERGPKMSRFLRNHDRNANQYPTLKFPEVYLLNNGYKEFFEKYKNLCEPESYVQMIHADHAEDLKLYRSKSKTWNSESRSVSTNSSRLKRTKSRLAL